MAGDYISRAAALEDFESCNAENPRWTPQRVKTLLLRQPAADVAEVRHGRWIELDECANEGVYCSVCHKKVYKIDYAWSNNPVKMKSPYCPNCGARMDKEDAEEGRG